MYVVFLCCSGWRRQTLGVNEMHGAAVCPPINPCRSSVHWSTSQHSSVTRHKSRSFQSRKRLLCVFYILKQGVAIPLQLPAAFIQPSYFNSSTKQLFTALLLPVVLRCMASYLSQCFASTSQAHRDLDWESTLNTLHIQLCFYQLS